MDYDTYLNAIQQMNNSNNAWSAEQAQKQMDFQERMSNTAHQREIADLKASGLNPVLSANQGASTPNGAMATLDSSNLTAMVSAFNKMLDIEYKNSAASAIHTYSGYVGNNTSLPSFGEGDMANVISALSNMAGIRINSNTAKSIMNGSKVLGSKISDALNLSENSNWRKYLSGELYGTELIKTVGNYIGSQVSNALAKVTNNSGSAKSK